MKLTWLAKVTKHKGPNKMLVPKITTRALCFFVFLEANFSKRKWYLDSGCSRYMTGTSPISLLYLEWMVVT